MNKKGSGGAYYFLALAALLIFVISFVLGAGYQAKKTGTSFAGIQSGPSAAGDLTSPLISSVVVYGQVTDISGNNITLSRNNSSLTISVGSNVVVNQLKNSTIVGQPSTATVSSFSNIKKGDYLNVAASMATGGGLAAQTVIIIPQ